MNLQNTFLSLVSMNKYKMIQIFCSTFGKQPKTRVSISYAGSSCHWPSNFSCPDTNYHSTTTGSCADPSTNVATKPPTIPGNYFTFLLYYLSLLYGVKKEKDYQNSMWEN